MSGVKAVLKVILQANDTIVAESEDAALWQQILLSINRPAGQAPVFAPAPVQKVAAAEHGVASEANSDAVVEAADDIGRFAKLLALDVASVEGACAPSKQSPYLTLDMHCWNSMKDQVPAKGRGSIGPIALAATLLALWQQTAKLGNATQAEAQKVLGTINLRDANAGRAIAGCEWLQTRAGGVVLINPSRIRRAVAIARAFCSQDWVSDVSGWKGE